MNWDTQDYVSLGGLMVGLLILGCHTALWWTGGKTRGIRGLLLPFLPIFLYGILITLSAGGILGGVAHLSLWGSNQVGDLILEYGVGSGTQNVTRNVSVVLTPPGHMVVVVTTGILVIVWWKSKKISRWEVLLFLLSGICFALSSGVAGLFAWMLAPAVNTVGGFVAGVL